MGERTTRERVRELVVSDPELNLSGIAERIGVSRERVRQIATEEGLAVARGVVGYRPRPRRPPASRVITGGVPVEITHTVAGTIGELLVAADLMARGFVVFAPIARHTASCDLIALVSGTPERIEVRCAKRREGKLRYPAPKARFDRLALVVTGETVTYLPAWP
jgi:hypothetical protein